MAEGDRDVLIQKGASAEVDANIIAGIIFHTCHCSQGRCITAANEIIDYLTAVMMATGAAEDITNPTGEVQ